MADTENWRGKHFSYFQNKECESFPCHPAEDESNFNCLFCYCPLYMLDRDCGGKFRFTASGIKDCSACTFPHDRGNYGLITGRMQDIAQKMKMG